MNTQRNTLSLALVAIATLAMADPSPSPAPSKTAPIPDTTKDNTLIYRADTPTGVWNGWGFASPPNPDSAKQPDLKPEEFDLLPPAAGVPQTFSGKIARLDSMDGVEIGLISLVGIYWNDKNAYQWQPVAPDGAFSIVNANYNDAPKLLVMRGPKTGWTFLRYNFKPGESAKNVVLHAAPSKKILVTASGSDMKNLSNIWVEGFDAHNVVDDTGNTLRRQHHGYFNANKDDHVDIVLPLGEIALFVHCPGWAGFYQIIDTRQADHFHFVLNAAGQFKITVLDAQGNPAKGVHIVWMNPAAPLSLGNDQTRANGSFTANSLVPGFFNFGIGPVNLTHIEIKPGYITNILVQPSQDPVITETSTMNRQRL